MNSIGVYYSMCYIFGQSLNCIRFLGLVLESNETRIRGKSSDSTLRNGTQWLCLGAKIHYDTGGLWSTPHTNWITTGRLPSATTLIKEHTNFTQRKFCTSSFKKQTVPLRSNHLNIWVYTFKFLQLHALSFDFRSIISWTQHQIFTRFIQYNFRNCKLHKIIITLLSNSSFQWS